MAGLISMETEKLVIGDDRVRVSLTLPTLPKQAQTPLKKGFEMYYGGMKKGFLRYANGTLAKEGGSVAAGAVLKSTLGLETDTLASLYVDAVISTEETRRVTRLPQLWDKQSGTLVRAGGLYQKRYMRALMPLLEQAAQKRAESAAVPLYSDYKALLEGRFKAEAFYLTPAGVAYIYQAGVLSDKNEVFPVHIDKSLLGSVLKESVINTFWHA